MKEVIVVLLLYGFHGVIFSQIQEPSLSALSPNAASLGLYGDIPVLGSA